MEAIYSSETPAFTGVHEFVSQKTELHRCRYENLKPSAFYKLSGWLRLQNVGTYSGVGSHVCSQYRSVPSVTTLCTS
jgi:hypothetical protein